MGRLASILAKLEKSLLAATFAEAGEFESACRFLDQGKNAHKRIVLGTDKTEINPQVVGQTLQLSQRIGGSVEIFHLLRLPAATSEQEISQERKTIDTLITSLGARGIDYQPIRADGCLADALLGHIKKRRNVLCVVFDALETREACCRLAHGKMLERLQSLSCPVLIHPAQA